MAERKCSFDIRFTDEGWAVGGSFVREAVQYVELGINLDEMHRRGFRGRIEVKGHFDGNARQGNRSRDELEESQG